MKQKLSILGSTGSIGTQALDVARKLNIKVTALTAATNVDLLEAQIREFQPKIVALLDERSAKDLAVKVADTNTKVLGGIQGICECAKEQEAEIVLNSIVGMAGLLPTLDAIDAGKDIALANKETLVTGGKLVMEKAKEKGVKIYPVDSEHSAIFQCLQGMPTNKALKKLILTASGGPFFGKTRSDLENVTIEQALNHPNWSMGAKITIDSATMMNKGLEIIEASWLFSTGADNIDVLVHRESIVHSMIEYDDNSVIAQMGVPDMRIPIQYALTYPDRFESPVKELDLSEVATLTFSKPDYETFDCLSICKEAIRRGGLYPTVVNSANEQANSLFRHGRIKFLEIGEYVGEALDIVEDKQDYNLSDIFAADRKAREFVMSKVDNPFYI